MNNDPNAIIRRQIYWLLIIISSGLILGRIAAVDNVTDRAFMQFKTDRIESTLAAKKERLISENRAPERIEWEIEKTREKLLEDADRQRATLSANDRSRWCTIRALVEPDMRVIREIDGERQYVWYAIDIVQDQIGWDTIDMCKHGLKDDPNGPEYLFSTKPPLLPLLMAVPYAVIYNASGGAINMDNNEFLIVRITLVICNLLPMILCWWLISRLIERFGTTDWGRIFMMGFVCFGTFASTFAVTINNHLPGIFCITVAMYAAIRIWFDDERRFRYFAICGFFSAFMINCELPGLIFTAFVGLPILFRFPKQAILAAAPMVLLVGLLAVGINYAIHQDPVPAYGHKEWYDYTYVRGGVERESYWNNRAPIDRGEKEIPTYILNMTLGHHGIFSLSPVWILSFIGIGYWTLQRKDPKLRDFALLTLAMSVGVLVFYAFFRPQVDRNYGGMCCGLRWMFWFFPLWTMTAIPIVDRMSKSKFWRIVALVLLGISVVSVAYPVWNPWIHPWLYNAMRFYGIPVIGDEGYPM